MAKKEPASRPVLGTEQIEQLMSHLVQWQLQQVEDVPRLIKKYSTASFADSMLLANQVANMAQLENHHPYLVIKSHSVRIGWWSENPKGLTEMDFIMAARCDELAERYVR